MDSDQCELKQTLAAVLKQAPMGPAVPHIKPLGINYWDHEARIL